jgi:hypothetical protein
MKADYVIVGAGSAGCVLANRLTEDPGTRVILIEAGGRDWNPLIHIPVGFMKLLDHPTLTWNFKAETDPGTAGRAIPYPRGRVLGGSSSINGLIYIRGQPEDFDHWGQLGNRGWSSDDVLPYFKRAESWQEGANDFHGSGGPLLTSHTSDKPALCERIIQAGLDDLLAQGRLVGGMRGQQRPAAAVELGGALLPVFGALEIGQHVVPRPAAIAELAPMVEILGLAADIDHAVDRRRAAEHAASRVEDRTVVDPGIGLGRKAPGQLRMIEQFDVPGRDMDQRVPVAPAGLDQDDPCGRIGRQPVRQHAPRRPGPDDYIVCLHLKILSAPETPLRTAERG